MYEGYLEKEGLLRKQLEILQRREAVTMDAVKMAEKGAIQSALEPDQVEKVRALNASKSREVQAVARADHGSWCWQQRKR